MSFLAPLALAGLLFLPVVLAMYLLKLRRDEAVVPSTMLWQKLVADVEANAPWQKLRRSLLLLLQLLLVIILVLLAARPFVERPAGLAGDIVLVIDTSASMQATDVSPSRLDAAKAAAIDALKELPGGGKVSVVAAGRTARVIANGTTDVGNVKQAIEAIEPTSDVGDLGDALRLASALAARSGDAEILVATDAALATPPQGTLEAPVRVLQVGREARNEAIVALAVRTSPSGLSHSAFISVANLGLTASERRIQLYADGVLRDSRVLNLQPQRQQDISIDDIDDPDHPASVIEVRLVAKDETDTAQADPLAVDDRAWAIVPPTELRTVLLVGDGDPYLETALSYLPDTELYGVSPDDYGPGTKPELFDLIIFEGFLPDELPAKPVLAIAPPETSPLGTVTGTLTNPGIGTLDPTEPVLRYVDLTTTHIGEAQRMELPAWARAIIPGPGTSPLLYAGTLAGQPAAVLAFEPRRSDLPLQVAFPVLLANLAGELLGGSETPLDAIAPGAPVTPGHPRRRHGRAGRASRRQRGRARRTARRRRVRDVRPHRPAGRLHRDADRGPRRDGGAVRERHAVLLARHRRRVARAPRRRSAPPTPMPRSGSRSGCSASTSRGSRPATRPRSRPWAAPRHPSPAQPGEVRPNARDEIWIPIVLIALLVLTLEWLVYERDTLARIRRSIAGPAARRDPRGTGRLMGISFDAPLALLLLPPLIAIVVALHLASRRRLGKTRRRVALGVRLAAALAARVRAGGLPAGACRSTGWPSCTSSTSPTPWGRRVARRRWRSCARAWRPRRTRTSRGSWRSAATRWWSGSRRTSPRSTASRPPRSAAPPTSGPPCGSPARCSPTTPRSGSCCCPTATTPPGPARPRRRSRPRAGSRSRPTSPAWPARTRCWSSG